MLKPLLSTKQSLDVEQFRFFTGKLKRLLDLNCKTTYLCSENEDSARLSGFYNPELIPESGKRSGERQVHFWNSVSSDESPWESDSVVSAVFRPVLFSVDWCFSLVVLKANQSELRVKLLEGRNGKNAGHTGGSRLIRIWIIPIPG